MGLDDRPDPRSSREALWAVVGLHAERRGDPRSCPLDHPGPVTCLSPYARMADMLRVILYARVSTEERARSGYSIADWMRELDAYARARDQLTEETGACRRGAGLTS